MRLCLCFTRRTYLAGGADRPLGGRVAVAAALILALLAASCGEPGTVVGRGIRLTGLPTNDTVTALVSQSVVIEGVPAGSQVVLRTNILTGPTGQQDLGIHFVRTTDGRSVRATDTVSADRNGRIALTARLGRIAGEAVIAVSVPATRASGRFSVVVRPGMPKRLVATPRDTALYIDRGYSLRTNLVDRFDNTIAVTGLTYRTDSSAVEVASTGGVLGRAIGRARLVVAAMGFSDTVWTSVVPVGRIAAVRFAFSTAEITSLVLVNLDGSAYRSFPLQTLDVPRPAWHPSGSYLVASILRIAPDGPNAVRRLAALDTVSGQWRMLAGTPGPDGDGFAQFSRDGAWLYVAKSPTNRYFSNYASAIYRVRTDESGAAEKVGYDAGAAFDYPSPSPDGTRVAISHSSNGYYTIVVPTDRPLGPVPQEATLVGRSLVGTQARWSPVGDDLLLFGTEGMWLMRSDASSASERRYLARDWASGAHVTGGFEGANWSPDGRWIVARAAAGLILIEVATNRVLPLPYGSGLSDPAWRPT